jgi:8-oxo-dGTP diphosphatase
MLYRLLYWMLGEAAGISFNILNLMLAGNLPPFVTVRLIVEEQGRYLAIEESKGYFSLPGGFTRWNEYPAQAAVRECEEETGLRVKLGDIVSQRATVSNRFDHISMLTITYQATIISGDLRGSTEGEPCWKSETELRDKMGSYSMQILEDYLCYQALQV